MFGFHKNSGFHYEKPPFNNIRITSEDLLILAIIFFLYNEDCKDTYLYIALFMLLFS